jgi:hypothetical protein
VLVVQLVEVQLRDVELMEVQVPVEVQLTVTSTTLKVAEEELQRVSEVQDWNSK